MTDYDYWRDALAGKNPEIHADHPCAGYYAYQPHRGAPHIPVAIWFNRGTGSMTAKIGYETLFEIVQPEQIWTWVGNHPVTYEAYQEVIRTHKWPNADSSEYQRLLAVLNAHLGVPDDLDGGELESLSVRFETARRKENQGNLNEKRMIDEKYRSVQDRIKTALKALKEREEA
jgi:hypothetical protein